MRIDALGLARRRDPVVGNLNYAVDTLLGQTCLLRGRHPRESRRRLVELGELSIDVRKLGTGGRRRMHERILFGTAVPVVCGFTLNRVYPMARKPDGTRRLFADAKTAEYPVQNVVGVNRADDLAQFGKRRPNFGGYQLFAARVGHDVPCPSKRFGSQA